MINLDDFSNKKIEITKKELTFIKGADWDKGWKGGLIVGFILAIDIFWALPLLFSCLH